MLRSRIAFRTLYLISIILVNVVIWFLALSAIVNRYVPGFMITPVLRFENRLSDKMVDLAYKSLNALRVINAEMERQIIIKESQIGGV